MAILGELQPRGLLDEKIELDVYNMFGTKRKGGTDFRTEKNNRPPCRKVDPIIFFAKI